MSLARSRPVPRLGRIRAPVLAVAALQVALPLAMLGVRWASEGSRPTSELPASWQMYSSAAVPTYTGIGRDETRRRLSVAGLPPVLRAVDTGELVPRRLCAAQTDLLAVERAGGPDPLTTRC